MHFRPYGLKCKKKTTTRGPGRSPGPLIASQAVGLRCSILYTLFLLEKEKVWQKEKARGIWAVRPRFHFCPSGKTIEINLCVLDSRWYTWDSGGFRWYKLQTKCILAWKWTISIGNLRLGPVKFRWSSHQCTMWFHNENRHQLVYLLVEKCSKGWIDWLIQDWLVVV